MGNSSVRRVTTLGWRKSRGKTNRVFSCKSRVKKGPRLNSRLFELDASLSKKVHDCTIAIVTKSHLRLLSFVCQRKTPCAYTPAFSTWKANSKQQLSVIGYEERSLRRSVPSYMVHVEPSNNYAFK